MFTSAGMSQWPSMFTRPSGELHESGEELFSLIAFVLLLAWAWTQRGAVALGGIAVFKWFVVRFAIDLLPLCFFPILSVYPTLDYVHYCEICEQKERESEREEKGNSKQPRAAPYPFICTLVCSLSSLKLILSGLW